MKTPLGHRQRDTGSARSTLLICVALVAIAMGILYGLRFAPGAEFIEQERRDATANKTRVVDPNSPVYDIATQLAGHMKLIQCDGEPSVKVGSQYGYRILLQNTLEKLVGSGSDTARITTRSHRDLVLVPTSSEAPPGAKKIRWEKLEQKDTVVAVYIGSDETYNGYGNMPILSQEFIRVRFKLVGGDDRVALLEQYLAEKTERTERFSALGTIASQLGEAAIPILMREIEENLYDQRGNAVASLRHIPGKKSTELLLSFYHREDTKHAARYALTMSAREEAKSVYLDNLISTGLNPIIFGIRLTQSCNSIG